MCPCALSLCGRRKGTTDSEGAAMRSTPIFKILSLAVLVAVVTLLGIEGYRYFHRSVSVSVAYTGQVTDSLSVTCWVVR